MTETRFLRADAGVACTGLTDPKALGAAQSSVQTLSLDDQADHAWTVEETARQIEAGDWSVTLQITTGGPNQAVPNVRVRVERRNSSCEVQETLVDDAFNLTNGVTQDYTWPSNGDPHDAVDFEAGDRLVVIVNRTNSSNRTATLRYAGDSPDDSRLVHPAVAAAEPEPTLLAGRSATGTRTGGAVQVPLSLSGRTATDTRAAGDITPLAGEPTALAGRSATATRAAGDLASEAAALAGRSSTNTRAAGSLSVTTTALAGRSATATRAAGDLTVDAVTRLAGRSATDTRTVGSVATPLTLAGVSQTPTRTAGTITAVEGEPVALDGRSSTDTRTAADLTVARVLLASRSSTATRARGAVATGVVVTPRVMFVLPALPKPVYVLPGLVLEGASP